MYDLVRRCFVLRVQRLPIYCGLLWWSFYVSREITRFTHVQLPLFSTGPPGRMASIVQDVLFAMLLDFVHTYAAASSASGNSESIVS